MKTTAVPFNPVTPIVDMLGESAFRSKMINVAFATFFAIATKAGKNVADVVVKIPPLRIRWLGPATVPIVADPARGIPLPDARKTGRFGAAVDIVHYFFAFVDLRVDFDVREAGAVLRDRVSFWADSFRLLFPGRFIPCVN